MPSCPECGNEVEGNQNFCDECGEELEIDSYMDNPVTHEEQKRERYGKETEDEDVEEKKKDGIDWEDQKEERYGKEVEEEGVGR